MQFRSRSATIPITVTSEATSWEYKHLTEIQILEAPHGRYARLICEHDCGGEMFTAHCSERNFVYLEPYAQWLRDNANDPYGVEQPVIPIFFDRIGRAFLSINGARADHAELPRPYKRLIASASCTTARCTQPAANPLHWLQNLFRS